MSNLMNLLRHFDEMFLNQNIPVRVFIHCWTWLFLQIIFYMHIRLHTSTINKHNINRNEPVDHVWVLPEIWKRSKIIQNFFLQCIGYASYTIDCSSCEVFRKSACDKLGTKHQKGRFVFVLLKSGRSTCGVVVHWLHKLGIRKYLQNITQLAFIKSWRWLNVRLLQRKIQWKWRVARA